MIIKSENDYQMSDARYVSDGKLPFEILKFFVLTAFCYCSPTSQHFFVVYVKLFTTEI